MALQRIACQCPTFNRSLWTTIPRLKKDKEWKKIEREKYIKYDKKLKKLQSSNPFKSNVGLKNQVSCQSYNLSWLVMT